MAIRSRIGDLRERSLSEPARTLPFNGTGENDRADAGGAIGGVPGVVVRQGALGGWVLRSFGWCRSSVVAGPGTWFGRASRGRAITFQLARYGSLRPLGDQQEEAVDVRDHLVGVVPVVLECQFDRLHGKAAPRHLAGSLPVPVGNPVAAH
jgi:hypothetical protein